MKVSTFPAGGIEAAQMGWPVAPGRRLKREIMAQRRMVVDVLVAQRQGVHPLAQQGKIMLDLAPLAAVEARAGQYPAVAAAKIATRKLRYYVHSKKLNYNTLLEFGGNFS